MSHRLATRLFKLGTAAALFMVMVAIGITSFLNSYFNIAGGCSDEVVREFPSSGGGVAVVYVSSCGATTPFITSVLVRNADVPFSPGHEYVFFRLTGKHSVEVRWPDGVLDGTARLQVLYPREAQIIRQAIRWDGMLIDYVVQDR